jgi:hypothetical protein
MAIHKQFFEVLVPDAMQRYGLATERGGRLPHSLENIPLT